MLPLLLLVLAGCAAGPRYPGPLRPLAERPTAWARERPPLPESTPDRPGRGREEPLGTLLASAAEYYLEHTPRGFRDDCSGFVGAVADRAGLVLGGSTKSMWEWSESMGLTHTRKTPRPGDLAFFDGTYDRDGNGRQDDDLTHVAVVISVDERGTITMAHGGTSAGRTWLRMNLQHPDVPRSDDGAQLNDLLRRPKRGESPKTRYLAGELWRGFATLRADALADESS